MKVIEKINGVAIGHADGSISCWDLDTGELRTSKQLFASAIVGMVASRDESCLVVAVDSLPTITCLDPESLEIIAELDAGTGNIIDIRTDLRANRIQIFGDQGAIRIWPFRKEVAAEVR
jgi:WD40 repeat protein